MKKILILVMILAALGACKKTPITGDLFISTEWQTVPEQDVEVWIYESYDKFVGYEYFDKQFSNEFGEVFFAQLPPGWYYLEAEKMKSSQFTIYKFDSVEVLPDRQINKILVMEPAK
jgi:hypothetical protein